jgi:hypothetical protein
MATQDTSQIKENIISFLKINGPSLPVHIGKYINQSMLFTSAFLSELYSEKRIKMSHMKIGSSSVYYLKDQEPQLERFSQYLKSKEKEAYELLREKNFLEDENQQPAIRVALRAIKDFAFPLEKENKLTWKYLTAEENSLKNQEPQIKEQVIEILPGKKEILEEIKEKKKKEIVKNKNPTKKKIPQKKDDKFFNRIKEHLMQRSIEILDIENFAKDHLILRIKKNNVEEILIAYNKKKLSEEDIIKANKKALEHHQKFRILSLGEPAKKTINLMEALKNLSEIEKIN